MTAANWTLELDVFLNLILFVCIVALIVTVLLFK